MNRLDSLKSDRRTESHQRRADDHSKPPLPSTMNNSKTYLRTWVHSSSKTELQCPALIGQNVCKRNACLISLERQYSWTDGLFHDLLVLDGLPHSSYLFVLVPVLVRRFIIHFIISHTLMFFISYPQNKNAHPYHNVS